MKINKRQFKRWIAALDSGEYKQAGGELQNKHGYCCLGVGCKVTIPTELISWDNDGYIEGGTPKAQPAAPQWLIWVDDDFIKKTGLSLMALNDDSGFTFPEIATLLELIYVHKMLD